MQDSCSFFDVCAQVQVVDRLLEICSKYIMLFILTDTNHDGEKENKNPKKKQVAKRARAKKELQLHQNRQNRLKVNV